jgi:hypothetical protein
MEMEMEMEMELESREHAELRVRGPALEKGAKTGTSGQRGPGSLEAYCRFLGGRSWTGGTRG